jgi:hypothetical protein
MRAPHRSSPRSTGEGEKILPTAVTELIVTGGSAVPHRVLCFTFAYD